MKLNNEVTLIIKNNSPYKFIKLLSSLKIEYHNFSISKEYFNISLSYDNYNKIIKYLNKKDYIIKNINGIYYIKKLIKEKYIFILTYIFSMCFLFFLTNTIFYININVDDEKIYKILEKELYNHGIRKYKLMKDFNTLENIKKEILLNNKDYIDWMSIERYGVTYNINITKRIKNNTKKEKKISDIIASKDAIIKHIEYSKGVVVKEIEEYVHKGETIISGNIIKSDKYLKGQVRSSGVVYGEVWYTVKVSVPFLITEYKQTGLKYNEYYIKIFNHKLTLINKYNLKDIMYEESTILDKPYLPFKIYKRETVVYNYVDKKLTYEQAYNKAIEEATSKINLKLKTDEYIIDKKVLKKTHDSSKIVLEVFFKVYERISLEKEIDKIEKGTDISKKGD